MHHITPLILVFLFAIQEYAVMKDVISSDNALRFVVMWGMLCIIGMIFHLIEEVKKK